MYLSPVIWAVKWTQELSPLSLTNPSGPCSLRANGHLPRDAEVSGECLWGD